DRPCFDMELHREVTKALTILAHGDMKGDTNYVYRSPFMKVSRKPRAFVDQFKGGVKQANYHLVIVHEDAEVHGLDGLLRACRFVDVDTLAKATDAANAAPRATVTGLEGRNCGWWIAAFPRCCQSYRDGHQSVADYHAIFAEEAGKYNYPEGFPT